MHVFAIKLKSGSSMIGLLFPALKMLSIYLSLEVIIDITSI